MTEPRKIHPIFPLPPPERECHSTPGDRPCQKCAEEDRQTKRSIVAVIVLSIVFTTIVAMILIATGKV